MHPTHGGDIYNNTVEHDFSVNINPLGCPEEVKKALAEAVKRVGEYPDIRQRAVRSALASWLKSAPANILCAGGASEIFSVLMNMLRPSCVLLTAPCFGGYEYAALGVKGCKIKRHKLLEEEGFKLTGRILDDITKETDVCFLCVPNNPTGVLTDAQLLLKILKRCREKGTVLIMDECFIELSGGKNSLLPYIGEYEDLYIVRAFTKLLAIPGVRFGYVVSCEKNISELSEHLPEWDLSVFAEAAGITGAHLLETGEYLKASLELIWKEREYLKAELGAPGIKIYPSDANFLLIKSEKDLYGGLLKRKILIRDCSNFYGLGKGYYRIAVKRREENMLLAAALKEVMRNG